jgi:hypothetical protein
MARSSPAARREIDLADALVLGFGRAQFRAQPFPNWRFGPLFPERIAEALTAFPFDPAPLAGPSGRRELHNARRRYFSGDMLREFPVAREVAEAFQSARVVQALMMLTGALLIGAFLRIEYAVDLDGFWLEPHTDLGVKAFSLLIQLGSPGQEALGTDLYLAPDAWAERVPFYWNSALGFVPSARSWHGFEPRRIAGVRRSLIVNYVTDEWRERGQLAFADRPVGLRRSRS